MGFIQMMKPEYDLCCDVIQEESFFNAAQCSNRKRCLQHDILLSFAKTSDFATSGFGLLDFGL